MSEMEMVIKAELDGWFYIIDYANGLTRASAVPVDFIPDHKSMFAVDDEDREHQNVKKFTAAQEEEIIRLRSQGLPWREIGKSIGRDVNNTRLRYLELCEERGLQPQIANVSHAKRIPEEVKRAIWRLRGTGMSFEEIGQCVGLTRQQATDCYQGLRRKRGWTHREAA